MDESEVLKFEQQQRITKLSQAIRIGARLRPQSLCGYFDAGRSCAIGAAYEAIFGFPMKSKTDHQGVCDLYDKMPVIRGLAHSIVGWNDSGMTREAIADRLEAEGF